MSKPKQKELTVGEVKKMIYKEIEKKKKAVDPGKFNMRIVEDTLAELEAMQQILAMIMDEEIRRKRQTDQQIKLGYGRCKIIAYRLATKETVALSSLYHILVLLFVYYLDISSKIWLQCTICNSTCHMLTSSYGASRCYHSRVMVRG